MQNKEFKLVLVKSDEKYYRCEDCVFFIGRICKELVALDCDYMAPSKKYHWELEEIKSETI